MDKLDFRQYEMLGTLQQVYDSKAAEHYLILKTEYSQSEKDKDFIPLRQRAIKDVPHQCILQQYYTYSDHTFC